ncbi:MAG: sigma-54-dependent Fis family transcriptional regulator [Candidatus Omnitrophota bacterium]|nr:MAG: sigma-54-dependent Fis family transcriptional regulator [Candidatus Omnitrophota bacterium]
MSSRRILLVDDDPSLCRVTQFQLQEAGYEVITATNGQDGLRKFREEEPVLVITDMKMPQMDGLELLVEIKRISPPALVIVITAHGSIETAIKAMKHGAHDYLCKPFEKDELLVVIEKALKFHGLMRENIHLREELLDRYRFENIVGGSEAIQNVFKMIKRLCVMDSTVLIEGESGTGKELIARAIHYNSARRKQAFIAVNCPAIPEHLMESELFGHVKGAFTGALNDHIGKFELADGGAIFLDEIADMRLDLQSKLLRVLQEKEIDKIGSHKSMKVDVRVIAATNKNLKSCVEKNTFREDLYYRLSVVPLLLPPLRDRPEDIPLLIQHFLRELGVPQIPVEPEIYGILQQYPWPGNVRELHNIVEQMYVLRQNDDRLTAADLPQHIHICGSQNPRFSLQIPPSGIVLDDVEKELIKQALHQAAGNQTHAAQLLGITRQTLIYRMEKYGLKVPTHSPS